MERTGYFKKAEKETKREEIKGGAEVKKKSKKQNK